LSVAQDPTPQELAGYYRDHQSKYRLPEKRSFTHIYFSPDRSGDTKAKTRAVETLKQLRLQKITRAPDRGDAFPGPSDYSLIGTVEAARVFGESEFSTALFAAPVEQWSGPYRSGFGWHLLYVQAVQAPRTPPLAEIIDAVRSDDVEETRERKNAEMFNKLRKQYTVVGADNIDAAIAGAEKERQFNSSEAQSRLPSPPESGAD